ncbi:unnamed protein product, partial [Staurois parvus]
MCSGTWLSQPDTHTKVCSFSSSPVLSAVSGHLLYCLQSLVIPCNVCSLWSSPVLSAVSGHPLYYVRSLWSSPVLCLHSLVIPCTMSCTTSAVSGHLCTVSAVSGHL